MAQLIRNSWTTTAEAGFIIRLRGAGNQGLHESHYVLVWSLKNQLMHQVVPKYKVLHEGSRHALTVHAWHYSHLKVTSFSQLFLHYNQWCILLCSCEQTTVANCCNCCNPEKDKRTDGVTTMWFLSLIQLKWREKYPHTSLMSTQNVQVYWIRITCASLTQLFKLLPKQNISVEPMSTIEWTQSDMFFMSLCHCCVRFECCKDPCMKL